MLNNLDSKILYTQRPSLPSLDELQPYLEDIWKTKWLSNEGKYHKLLEKSLCEFLNVPYMSLVSNGTMALLIALRALKIKGEVITTPFSFVATSNSIIWNNSTPIFVDTEADGFNINPSAIEKAISNNTSAILPLHCYGKPCKIDLIQKIADKYNLKVIYDAAHAFGVKLNEKSLLSHGDLSIVSFHATKVFNTLEGGAIICKDEKMKRKLDQLKNFGFQGEDNIEEAGINAKLNEVQSALGIIQLNHINEYIKSRKIIYTNYYEQLKEIQGLKIITYDENTHPNFGYMPLLVESKCSKSRDYLYQKLIDSGIQVKRYFYPIITEYKAYSKNHESRDQLTNAKAISKKVICLPINPTLKFSQQQRVINLIKEYCT
tara:strand:- start:1166 stop:2290 length:1125 start_codon:yes stop_codon:yes gene_type:complete